MKTILISTLLTVAAFSVFANDDDSHLEEASVGYVSQVLATCKEYAVEDEVAAKDLNSYLLECVNDDLDANGYKKITSLPSQ